MYKVLIVDDEYYFRQAMKISIAWEELGLQLVGEAKNGEEALEQTRRLVPDIIMVDINMPIMDGLAFIEAAKAEGFDSKFIVLTGHSEFAYAKQALRLGVFNYVLKPIDEDEIHNSLYEIKMLIDRERNEKIQLDDLKKQAKKKTQLMKNQLLNDWLLGNLDPQDQEERMQNLGIDVVSSYYLVAVIHVTASDDQPYFNPLHKNNFRSRMTRLIRQEAHQSLKYEGFFNGMDQFVLVFGSNANDFGDIGALCETIRTMLVAINGCIATVGMGNGHFGLQAGSTSYKEALYALKHRFILGNNRVIDYSKVTQSAMKVSLYSVEKRRSLLMSMRRGKTKEVEQWLADFFSNARSKNASLEMLLVAGFEIFSTCLEFLEETSQDMSEIAQSQTDPDLFQLIEQMNTLSEMEEWIRDLIRKIMDHVHANKSSRSAIIVEEVKSFIDHNYANEELKIEDIARGVHVNYNHLCSVFKRETSYTINHYLTQFRMQKAKELFDQGHLVVQEVASKVGYSDANYFGKIFKRHLGISPSQYINNVSHGQ